MEDKLVTLAIHTNEKAQILKHVLEGENIEVHINDVDLDNPGVSAGVRIRIKESDLPKALSVVESRHLFSYDEEETYRTDDGRQRILIPVDFSDYSLKACRIAFNLARELGAKVKYSMCISILIILPPFLWQRLLPIRGKRKRNFKT